MDSSKPWETLRCGLCKAEVGRRSLEWHLREELGYAAWRCRLCSTAFFSPADAQRHFSGPLSRHPAARPDVVELTEIGMERKLQGLIHASLRPQQGQQAQAPRQPQGHIQQLSLRPAQAQTTTTSGPRQPQGHVQQLKPQPAPQRQPAPVKTAAWSTESWLSGARPQSALPQRHSEPPRSIFAKRELPKAQTQPSAAFKVPSLPVPQLKLRPPTAFGQTTQPQALAQPFPKAEQGEGFLSESLADMLSEDEELFRDDEPVKELQFQEEPRPAPRPKTPSKRAQSVMARPRSVAKRTRAPSRCQSRAGNEKRFRCKECSLALSSSHIANHIASKHLKEATAACRVCGREWAAWYHKGGSVEHAKRQHPEQPYEKVIQDRTPILKERLDQARARLITSITPN